MQHAEQIGAAAAGRVHCLDRAQSFQNAFGIAQLGRVPLVHEARDCCVVFRRQLRAEIPLQPLPTHKRHDRLRRIVAARLVPARYQFLEYFAEHLRIDRHFHVERRALGDGEVVARKEVVEDAPDGRIGHADSRVAVIVVLLK